MTELHLLASARHGMTLAWPVRRRTLSRPDCGARPNREPVGPDPVPLLSQDRVLLEGLHAPLTPQPDVLLQTDAAIHGDQMLAPDAPVFRLVPKQVASPPPCSTRLRPERPATLSSTPGMPSSSLSTKPESLKLSVAVRGPVEDTFRISVRRTE